MLSETGDSLNRNPRQPEKDRVMNLEQALKQNPFREGGSEYAYCRYLRYTVDGFYEKDSKEVLKAWKNAYKSTEILSGEGRQHGETDANIMASEQLD